MALPKIKTLEELVDFYRYWPGKRPVPMSLLYSPASEGAKPFLHDLTEENRRWLYARLKDLKESGVRSWVIEAAARQMALQLHRREMRERGYFDEQFQFVEDWTIGEDEKNLVIGWQASGRVDIGLTSEKSQGLPASTDSKADGTEP